MIDNRFNRKTFHCTFSNLKTFAYAILMLFFLKANVFSQAHFHGDTIQDVFFDSGSKPGKLVPPLIIGDIFATAVAIGLYARSNDGSIPSGDFAALEVLGVMLRSSYFGFSIGSPLGAAIGINIVDRRGMKIFLYDLAAGYIPHLFFQIVFYNNIKAKYISAPISGLILTPIFVYYSHKHFSSKYVIRESNHLKVSIYPMIEPSDLFRKNILTGIGLSVSF